MISSLITGIVNLLDKLLSFSDPLKDIDVNLRDHPSEISERLKASRLRKTILFNVAIGITLSLAVILLGGIYKIIESYLEKPDTEIVEKTIQIPKNDGDTYNVQPDTVVECDIKINHIQNTQDSLFVIENQGKSAKLYTDYMYNLAFIRTHNDAIFCDDVQEKINENFNIINQIKKL